MSAHLCLSCRHAEWVRRNGRLTGIGYCQAPNPELPPLAATKWWAFGSYIGEVRGGYLDRHTKNPVEKCHFYEKGKR